MILTVKATPNAPKTAIKRFENGILYVSVAAPPEKGEANAELIKFLSKKLKIPRSEIELLSGGSSRLKRVKVAIEDINALIAPG